MNALPRSRVDNRRCSICGRQADTGQQTDLGWAGPECQRKVAALPKVLDALGLDIGTGLLQLRAERVGWSGVSYKAPYDDVQSRLRKAGLTLERVGGIDWSNPRPVATFRIRVSRVRTFGAVVKSYTEVRREVAIRMQANRDAYLESRRKQLLASAEVR